jgi:predicted KAP-like P-loop ATPase
MSKSEVPPDEENRTAAKGFLYDTALRQPDQDRLGRAEFARFLARAIIRMDAQEGFVFALNGPWGAGKTTIINFVLHFIGEEEKEKNELVVVRFNPWWFSGREQLIQQFFRQFKATLGGQDAPKELRNVSQKLDRLARILEPLTLVPAVGGWVDRVKNVFRTSATATQAIAEAMAQDIHEIRASIDSTLRNQNARILVVIDDIDRLHAEEIQQLFQVVKAVADFPKTIYLLAFDRGVVASAVSRLQGASGDDYLEKIVQAPFDLPIPDRTSLRRLLLEQIDEVLGGTPEELWDNVEWGNLYWDGIDTFIRTPRDVKRFVNILRPTYAIVKGEVNPIDFLGIQALRLFVPEMYSFVVTNKDQLTGAVDRGMEVSDRPEDRRKLFDSFLEGASGDRRRAIQDIMGRLFPRWASAYGDSSYGSEWFSVWRKKLRICSPDVCDRYFMLSLLPGDVSSVEMQALLSLGGDPEAFGKELLRLSTERRPDGTTRLRVFLERMQDFTESDVREEHIEPILRAIYNVGDQLFLDEDRAGMFDHGNDMRLLRISYQLLKRLPTQQQRFETLRKIFSEAKSVSLVTHDVIILGQEHGKYREREPTQPEEQRTVAANHLPELEAIALRKIREAAEEKRLHAGPDFGYLLYQLAEWSSEDEAKAYVSQLVVDDIGVCDFLSGLLQYGYSHGFSDRVARRAGRIHLPSVQKFFSGDPSELVPRYEKILKDAPTWLNQRRKVALETFIKEVKEPLDEWGRPRRETQ